MLGHRHGLPAWITISWMSLLAWAGCSGKGDAPGETAVGSRVAINEVACQGSDWVELLSVSKETVDLSGWTLTDNPANQSHLYVFAQGTTLAPGARLVVAEETQAQPGFPFGIACGADRLSLFDSSLREEASLNVPELGAGQTWGRLPDGAGGFQATSPTPGAPNQSFGDRSAELYDSWSIGRVQLTLSEAAMESLRLQPREWVSGEFNYTWPDGTQAGPSTVGVRLKGGAGSFRPLQDKPSFKIDFNQVVSGQRFYGLKSLTLNNLAQDPTALREALVYRVFREFQVPAPRVGYATLTLNGRACGLYVNVETPDRTFLARWFESTNHLYEGEYGADLRASSVPGGDNPTEEGIFAVDVGDEDSHEGLVALVQALAAAPPSDVLSATRGLVDWDEVRRMMAVELWSGHWDGYASSANNYFLHEDGQGRFSLVPWGADQSFTAAVPFLEGRGLLLRRCTADAVCRAALLETLLDLQTLLDELDLDSWVIALAGQLTQEWLADPHRATHFDGRPQPGQAGPWGPESPSYQFHLDWLLTFLHDRHRALCEVVSCPD